MTIRDAKTVVLLEAFPRLNLKELNSPSAIDTLWTVLTARRSNLNIILRKKLNEPKVKSKKA